MYILCGINHSHVKNLLDFGSSILEWFDLDLSMLGMIQFWLDFEIEIPKS